jgi:hypothetical protein
MLHLLSAQISRPSFYGPDGEYKNVHSTSVEDKTSTEEWRKKV